MLVTPDRSVMQVGDGKAGVRSPFLAIRSVGPVVRWTGEQTLGRACDVTVWGNL